MLVVVVVVVVEGPEGVEGAKDEEAPVAEEEGVGDLVD